MYHRILLWKRSYSLKIILLALFLLLLSNTVDSAERKVLNIRVEGIIDPVTANYIVAAVSRAENQDFEALVIELDTPGGLDESMRLIVKKLLNSKVPTIVYVSPSGARAASAGTFITLAANIAAMAPGTNIGAAHPVTMGGEMPEEVKKKAVNDAVAYIRGIALKRGKNTNWAENAVRKSVSITATQALAKNVIDYVAADIETLLAKIDGVKVKTAQTETVLKTKGASIVEQPMTLRQRLLHILANPNVAYLLLMLGFYGLLYELASPGFGFAGIVGGIFLILAFYSLQIFPVNYAGLALIILGVSLLVAEALNPGFGVLGIGGIIALTIGSLILIEIPVPAMRVSPFVVIPTVITTTGFIILAIRSIVIARRKKPITGIEALIEATGEAKTDLSPNGQVLIHGELWQATAKKGVIKKGEKIKVVSVDGLALKVDKLEG